MSEPKRRAEKLDLKPRLELCCWLWVGFVMQKRLESNRMRRATLRPWEQALCRQPIRPITTPTHCDITLCNQVTPRSTPFFRSQSSLRCWRIPLNFYKTPMLVTVFTAACQLYLSLNSEKSSPRLPTHSLRIPCNLILPSTPRSTKQFLRAGFPIKSCKHILHHTCHLILHHLMAVYHIASTRNDEVSQYVIIASLLPLPPLPNKFFNTLFSNTYLFNTLFPNIYLFQHPILEHLSFSTPYFRTPIFFNTLFSNSLSLPSSINASHNVSFPRTTARKNYSSVCRSVYILIRQTGRQKIWAEW